MKTIQHQAIHNQGVCVCVCASQCNVPPTNLEAPAWYLKIIKDKHAEQTIKNLKHPTESMCCLSWTTVVVKNSF